MSGEKTFNDRSYSTPLRITTGLEEVLASETVFSVFRGTCSENEKMSTFCRLFILAACERSSWSVSGLRELAAGGGAEKHRATPHSESPAVHDCPRLLQLRHPDVSFNFLQAENDLVPATANPV
jgi:hypothetical protein